MKQAARDGAGSSPKEAKETDYSVKTSFRLMRVVPLSSVQK
jgi:hypothetical protein